MVYKVEATKLVEEERWSMRNVHDQLLAEERINAIELEVEDAFLKDYLTKEEHEQILKEESDLETSQKEVTQKKNTYIVAAINSMLDK